MSPAQTLLSAEGLLSLPDDGCRHELVKGRLTTTTPSGSEQSVITATLARLVDTFVSARELGLVFGAEDGFKIASDPDTVRAPDLAFVRRERIPSSGIPKGFWPGAPDVVAEVVSPGDKYEEVEEKVVEWLSAGTALVWIVNPRHRTVTIRTTDAEVRILSESDELLGGDVLPGFACGVSELFP